MKFRTKLLLGAALVCGFGVNTLPAKNSVQIQEIARDTAYYEECVSAAATQNGLQTHAKSAY